jgi:hypothetical protein
VALGALSLFAWLAPVVGLAVSVGGLFLGGVARDDREGWHDGSWVYAGSILSMIGFWLTIWHAIAGPFV